MIVNDSGTRKELVKAALIVLLKTAEFLMSFFFIKV